VIRVVITPAGSAKQLEESSFILKAYPNPASDIVYVNADNVSSLTVRNLIGQIVLANTDQSSIDVSSLTSGIYILEASVGSKITTTKIVKE